MATQNIQKRAEEWKSWYKKNKLSEAGFARRKQIRDFDKKRRKELAGWFEDYKIGLKCQTCGEDHPAVIDFHHRDPEDKLYEVSVMPHRSISKKKILEEIAKCDVLCSNCHRIFHYNEKKGIDGGVV